MKLLDYTPSYQPYFEKLNKAWLQEFFFVEPIDEYVLTNPEGAILKDGGKIYFAEHDGKIIGTVALRPHGDKEYELTKMAVDKAFQGIGAGKFLCSGAIEKAKELGAKTVILYSSRKLENAIGIYRKLGFQEMYLEPGKYERANIKMQLEL